MLLCLGLAMSKLLLDWVNKLSIELDIKINTKKRSSGELLVKVSILFIYWLWSVEETQRSPDKVIVERNPRESYEC